MIEISFKTTKKEIYINHYNDIVIAHLISPNERSFNYFAIKEQKFVTDFNYKVMKGNPNVS
jgi:hypothetical protein